MVLVEVNGHHLTASIFAQRLAKKLKELDVLQIKKAQNIIRVKNSVVDEFIHESIIAEWAERKNLIVSQQEVEQKMRQVRQDYPDDVSFRKSLVQSNNTIKSWREDLQKKILEQKVFKSIYHDTAPPTIDNLRSYYKTHRSSFIKRAKVYIEHFLFETKSDAQDLHQKLKNGMTDYATLIRSYNTSVNYSKIWVEKGDVFNKAFSMKIGVWSDVLKSSYGYHIYRVLDKSLKKQQTFKEAKNTIYKILIEQRQQAAYFAWLEKRVNQLKVFRNNEAISNIYIETIAEK